ncbi:CarD family transcriptional regulator [Treponema socranskii]|uniref:CarD family transcriptional regulator n=1 Tax=Treponema socranskii TaxID=53419 RepID=UPI003D6FDCEA
MAKTTTPKKSIKSAAKAKQPVKTKKTAAKPAKAAAKPAVKSTAKPAAKNTAKSGAKSASKTSAKVATKSTVKSAEKKASKTSSVKSKKPMQTKASAKNASKTVPAKSAGTATPKTEAAKPVPKKSKSSRFRINQKIVYPSQGVGKITDINEQIFREQTMLYYNIYIEASDMVVMVPVERAEELGIRAIVSAAEAETALNLLSDDFEPITSDWKLRYQMNLDLLKKGSINDIATIVRCLYNRSKVKELPILERKLYDSARKLLEDEISFATGKSLKEVETLIHIKLEPPGAAPKVKHVINIDDDEDDNLMDDMNTNSNDSDDGDASDDDSSYDDDSF